MEWKLGAIQDAAPLTSAKAPNASKCGNCRTPYSEDSIYCRNCGVKRPEARSQDDKRRIRLFALGIQLMVADLIADILFRILCKQNALLMEAYGNLLMSRYPIPAIAGLHSGVLVMTNCASSSCTMRSFGLLLFVLIQCLFLIACRTRFYLMFCEDAVPIGMYTAGFVMLVAVYCEVRFRIVLQKLWLSRLVFYCCSYCAALVLLAIVIFFETPPQVMALMYGIVAALSFLLDDVIARPTNVESWADVCIAVLHAHWRLCTILPRILTYLFAEEVEEADELRMPTTAHVAPASSFNADASGSGEMPYLPGLDVHYRVPPHKWCVTRRDVEQFVSDVRDAWMHGEIPDAEDAQFRNPYHNDPCIGPNMYQVNKHFIQPKTYANGGMSYALMLHPEGLPVDLFMTHAWAEGIFEFSSKLLRNWPKGAQNVWCCFLANPQNCDIGSLLGDDVLQSPFAHAIREAKKMIAIPNRATSIYTRMWCVLEAKLGIENGLDIIIPTAASPAVMRRAATHGYICMASSIVMSFAAINLLKRNVLWSFTCMLLLTNTWCALAIFLNRASQRANGSGFFMVQEARMGLIGLFGGFLFHTFAIRDVSERSVVPMRPAGFVILALGPLINYRILHRLRKAILEEEAQQLEFDTVLKAECTSEGDKKNILEAIRGEETNIDGMIRNLQAAGVYNARVREDMKLGFDPAHGYSFSWAKAFATLVLWSFCFAGSMISFPPPTFTGFLEEQMMRTVDIHLFHRPHRTDLDHWPMRCREFLCFLVMSCIQIPLVGASTAFAQPRYRQAKYYVDMMWTSGCCFLISYCLLDSLTWLWEASRLMTAYPHARFRRLSYFKDWGSVSAFAIAMIRVILGPRALGRFSLFWRCVIRTVQIIYIGILFWCYRRAPATFESCVATCAETAMLDLDSCVHGCFWGCSWKGILIFALGIFSAAVLRVMKAPRKHIQKQAAEIEMGTLSSRRKSRRLSPARTRISSHTRSPTRSRLSTMSSASSFLPAAYTSEFTYTNSEPENTFAFSRASLRYAGGGFVVVLIAVILGATTPLPRKSTPYETSRGVIQFVAMDLSRDARYVLLAGVQDCVARLSSVTVGRTVQTFEGHGSPVTAAVLSSSDHALTIDDYAQQGSQHAVLWSTWTGAPLQKIRLQAWQEDSGWKFHTLNLNLKASRALLGAIQTEETFPRAGIWAWHAEGENASLVFEGSGVTAVALNAELSIILLGFNNGSVALFHAGDAHFVPGVKARILRTFAGHSDRITSLALTPDGSRILSGSQDRSVRLWDALNGKELHKIDSYSAVEDAAMSEDANVIAVVNNGGTNVWEAPFTTRRAGHACSGAPIKVSADGRKILSYCESRNQAMLWSVEGNVSYFGEPLEHVYISGNLRRLLVRWKNGSVSLRERNNLYPLKTIDMPFIYARMNDEGTLMLATFRPYGHRNELVRPALFDLATGDMLQPFNADRFDQTDSKLHILLGSSAIWAVTYIRARDKRAGDRNDFNVRIWNTSNGEIIANFSVPLLSRVQIGNHRWFLVTGSQDGKIRVFHVDASGGVQEPHDFRDYRRSEVSGLEFSLKDQRLLTATEDGCVQLWDTAEGKLIRTREPLLDCYGVQCASVNSFQIVSMALDPAGTFMLLAKRSRHDASIQIELVSERDDFQVWKHDFGPDVLAATWVKFDERGDQWYLFSNHGQLTMWDKISQEQSPRMVWYVFESRSWAWGW